MKGSFIRQFVANILMVDDAADHKGRFCQYLANRKRPNPTGHGDLKPHYVGFADDLKSLCDDVAEADEVLDVVLLDVRIPKNLKDTKVMQAHQFPPRVAEIATQLQRHPAGKNARIVVFTLFRWVPEVQRELENIQRRFANIVRIYSGRPLISNAIAVGLKSIGRGAFSVTGTNKKSVEFWVRPLSSTTVKALGSAEFFLNGCQPTENVSFQDATGRGQHLFFDKKVLFERDINYFSAQIGRERAFRIVNRR